MNKSIANAIMDLGYAIHAKGIDPRTHLAIKMKSPAFDQLVEELKAMAGPDNQRNFPINMADVSIMGIKVKRDGA